MTNWNAINELKDKILILQEALRQRDKQNKVLQEAIHHRDRQIKELEDESKR